MPKSQVKALSDIWGLLSYETTDTQGLLLTYCRNVWVLFTMLELHFNYKIHHGYHSNLQAFMKYSDQWVANYM